MTTWFINIGTAWQIISTHSHAYQVTDKLLCSHADVYFSPCYNSTIHASVSAVYCSWFSLLTFPPPDCRPQPSAFSRYLEFPQPKADIHASLCQTLPVHRNYLAKLHSNILMMYWRWSLVTVFAPFIGFSTYFVLLEPASPDTIAIKAAFRHISTPAPVAGIFWKPGNVPFVKVLWFSTSSLTRGFRTVEAL